MATLLSLLLVEGIVRAFVEAPEVKPIRLASADCVYQRSTNPILGFELKANYRNQAPDFIRTYERTNSHGQRDRERQLEKPGGVRRILLLGDSVVEGYGLPEPNIISTRLEKLFTEGDVEVLNFGVSAYCTRAEVELLEVKGLRFDPDVVVIVFVENDFDNFNREAFPLEAAVERPAIVEGLFLRSQLFRVACLRWNLFQFAADSDPVRWNEVAIGDNNVFDGLKRLAELAAAHDFEPLVAVWPRFVNEGIVDVNFMPENDQELVIERLAAMHGIPSVRLSEFFRRDYIASKPNKSPRLYYSSGDELHPSAQGAKVAAQALHQAIVALERGVLQKNQAAVDSERTSDVVEVARSLGQDRPTYARVYNRMGTDLLRQGKLNEAAEQFRKALQEDPRSAGAHNNLGLVYERQNKPEAEDEFEQAIRLDPQFVHAHFNLARWMRKQGRSEAAVSRFQRTIELAPDHVDALNFLGVELGKLKRLAEAQRHLERALQIDPQHAEAHNNLGVVYASQGKLKQAVKQFQSALANDPNHRRAEINLRNIESVIENPK